MEQYLGLRELGWPVNPDYAGKSENFYEVLPLGNDLESIREKLKEFARNDNHGDYDNLKYESSAALHWLIRNKYEGYYGYIDWRGIRIGAQMG